MRRILKAITIVVVAVGAEWLAIDAGLEAKNVIEMSVMVVAFPILGMQFVLIPFEITELEYYWETPEEERIEEKIQFIRLLVALGATAIGIWILLETVNVYTWGDKKTWILLCLVPMFSILSQIPCALLEEFWWIIWEKKNKD